jgi:serine/threonine protein kinase
MAHLKNALSLQSMLGGYQLVDELGHGTYGAVYRGVKDGKTYALKEQRHEKDGSLPHGFLREAAIVMNARHRNIVQVQELLFLEDRLVLVMECATLTLSKWLRSPHTLAEKFSVAFQILNALYFLHHHHCIHCDLKPDNILLFKDGSVKVADYGLSVHNYGQKLSTNVQSVWWRAPEVIQGYEYYDGAVDMWSYGVILYQLFTGQHLFTETKPPLLLHCQQYQLTERLTCLAATHGDLVTLITGCLQCVPSARLTALQALALPIFRQWPRSEGSWYSPPARQVAQHWYLEQLRTDEITTRLIYQLVTRCTNRREPTIIACAAIAIMLLRNTWPTVPGYSPSDLRAEVQAVCLDLRCAFY